MRSCRLLFLICVVVEISASPSAWKSGTAYRYHLTGRTLTTILQAQDSYTGIVLQGKLELRLTSHDVLSAKLTHLKYASMHLTLPGGWSSSIPEKNLDFKNWPISNQPFEIKLKDGLIDGLVVSGDVTTEELNILKAVVSLLQVDTEGKNLVRDRHNSKPNRTVSAPNAFYRKMEDSITGKCEVLYDIAPLPPYLALAQPQIAPLVKNIADTPLIQIVKTQNYSNCDRRISYSFGFPGSSEFQHPDENQVGEFLARSSVSRIVVSGSLRRFTIQSSVTTNKIILSPFLYNKQKAMVVGSLNLTLASLRSASGSSQLVANRKEERSLAYTYENALGYERESSESAQSEASRLLRLKFSNEELPSGSRSRSSLENMQSKSMPDASSNDESNEPSFISDYSRNHKRHSDEESSGGYKLKRSAYIDTDRLQQKYSEELDGERVISDTLSNEESGRQTSESRSAESENDSGSEYSRKSAEEYKHYLPLPSLLNAPSLPMLPLFTGISGKSIAYKINIVETVRKISADVARDISSHNSVVKRNSLTKFAILTEVIRTMNVKQLQTATSSLYFRTSPSTTSDRGSQALRLNSWVAFRDAVSQAGTTPALMAIKDWILTSKVKGEEAAELIAVLPSSSITPTPKHLEEFFKLATASEVKKQSVLNETALLEFTQLLRLSRIDNATAHKYYPVHVFGQFSSRVDQAVQEKYIPFLKQSLKDAVAENDSVKIQVNIRAIGNIAHPKILEVFEPYLEKQTYVTTFQRTLMVVALNQLAKIYPEVARNVLFKIYQNTEEAYELRSAAVFLLFSTNPPAAILQRMAEFTNYETNMQVNTAVITGIMSLSNLKDSAHCDLARNARSAINILNTTTVPLQFTSTNVKSYKSDHLALGYSQTLNYIGSYDTIIPKAVFYNVTRNVGGFKHSYYSLGGMVSSVEHLLERLKNHVLGNEQVSESNERQSDKEWSPSKLRSNLNFKPSIVDPLEGNVMFKYAGISRFLAFDEKTLKKLPAVGEELMKALGSERSFNFTKFYSQLPVTLAFPMATGLPFVYALKTPSVISVGGKARLRTEPEVFSRSSNAASIPKTVNASADLDIWCASKLEAEIGFVTKFDSKHYIAGIQKNIEINLPVKVKIDVDVQHSTVDLRAEPINTDIQTTILHYSAEPYIVRHDILNLKPLQEENDYEKIEDNRGQKFETIFGEQSTGMAISWNYESSEKWNSRSKIFDDAKKDPRMLLYYPWAEDQIKYENASLTYLPHRSSTSFVAVSLSYESMSNVTQAEQLKEDYVNERSHSRRKKSTRRSRQGNSETEAIIKIVREESRQERMAALLDQVGSGLKGKSAVAVDFSAQFGGEMESTFIATAALARTPIDENSHFILSTYTKPVLENQHPLHVFLNVSTKAPNVPLINFKEALKAIPFVAVNASLYFDDTSAATGYITTQALFNQSEERRQYISQHPMAQLCESQMNEGNNALPACRNVTAEANYMDQLEISLSYYNIPVSVKNATYKFYSWLHSYAYPYINENVFEESYAQNNIRVISKLSTDLKELNVFLESPIGNAKLEDFPLEPIAGPLLAVHPVYSVPERFSRVMLGDQLNAKCSVGASAINTFNNNTYQIHLDNCWHIMMVIAPNQYHNVGHTSHYLPRINEDNDVAVLVRDSNSPKKEVKIITGVNVVDITPDSLRYEDEETRGSVNGKVRINERSIKISSNNVTEVYNDEGYVWVQIYFMDPSSLKLRFPLHGLKMIYDGETVQLSANNSFRNGVKGLCGTFNSEPITDFTAPNGKFLNDTQLFAAIYSIPQHCQGPATTLRRKALQKAVVSVYEETTFPNVIDMLDILGGMSLSSSSSSSEILEPIGDNIRVPTQTKPAVKSLLRTTVFDMGSEVCFSVYPLPACSRGARPSSRIEKSIPVYCLLRKNPTAKKLEAMIENGLNPDLRRKGATKYLKVSLPKSCVGN